MRSNNPKKIRAAPHRRLFQIQWSFTKIKQTESNKKVALFPHGDIASPDCPDCKGATPCAYHAICNDCDGNDKCLVHTRCPDNYGNNGKTKMHQYSIACSFVAAIGDFDVTPDRTRVFWTGHITEGRYNNDIYRRSGSYIPEPNEDQTLNRVIIMTPYKTATREIPHEALTEQEILEGSVGTLLHELSHQMSAPDHYCYKYNSFAEYPATDPDAKCGSGGCYICVHRLSEPAEDVSKDEVNRIFTCVMYKSDVYNYEHPHCSHCKDDIYNYIEKLSGGIS